MVPFDAESYKTFMETKMPSWLDAHVTALDFKSFDGRMIRCYEILNPDAKGILVMTHGYSGYFQKFHELSYNFFEEGYSIFFLELRGHGFSSRSVPELDRIDVTDFSEYVSDMKELLGQIVKPEAERTALPLFLFAHSMGGCVSALFLSRYPEYFQAAILSSPMIAINYGSTPLWRIGFMMSLSKLFGWNNRLLPGAEPFDGRPDYEGSGALSRARYDYDFSWRVNPEMQGKISMINGTYRWARAAFQATREVQKCGSRIRCPLLLCQAGVDTYVDNAAQERFMKDVEKGLLLRFPEARHEIFNSDGEILSRYCRSLFEFLEQHRSDAPRAEREGQV